MGKIHLHGFRTDAKRGLTRCGRNAFIVRSTADKQKVTCKMCLKLVPKD